MLSYRHGFHAGNHADVLKHSTLMLCLEAMQGKDKPLFVLDTHAGAGEYDLASEYARKTGEAADGIARLWPEQLHLLPQRYAQSLKDRNGSALRHYPGSCALIADWLRPQDSAAFCERHSHEHAVLRENFANSRRIALHSDGFAAIRALLPPQCKRGMVLLDPSYETDQDYQAVAAAAAEIRRRFRAAVVLIWYPQLPAARRMLAALARLGIEDSFVARLAVRAETSGGLFASGMIALNPPYRLDQQLSQTLPPICEALALDSAASWSTTALDDFA